VVALLGGFHGLYFDMLIRATGYRAAYVLMGAAGTELLLTAVLAALIGLVKRRLPSWKPVPVSACLLLGFGMAWFFMRLRS
jgi:hypothetical protein